MEIDATSYLKFIFALMFVLGLIGGLAILAKRIGLGNRGPKVRGKSKRLSIVETMALDAKRRMVIVRHDDEEHLLLLGNTTEQILGKFGVVEPDEEVRQLKLASDNDRIQAAG